MGGVAGHMDHLYDNPDLTFSEMKEIMTAASNGELTYEEKVDGQNIFLSYSIPEGKAKGARNKGNLKSGGLDASGLAQKFAGRGELEKAFNVGFNAFETAVDALSDEEKQRIFGPDTNIWYNAEVMDPGAPNVILYDDKTLKIHNVGHFVFDKESGEKSPIPRGSLETLDSALERMQQQLRNHDFSIAREALINIQKLEEDTALRTAINKINRAIAEEGLSDTATVEEYVFSRLMNGIDTNFPDSFKENIVRYLLGLKGNIGKRALKQGLSKEDALDLEEIILSKKSLLQEAILPIEMAVHDFTVALLKGLKSIFIADTDREVQRLKNELSQAVRTITQTGPENPKAMQVMQRHLNKIKDFSQITTPVEAVVFDFNGHTYKFAGNFAPLNQILGMFKYQKGTPKITNESQNPKVEILSEQDGKRVALIPGGFKPPHAGHFMLAKHFANKKDVDEVVVIVSTKSRPPVTVDMAIKLWELYTKEFPKIKVQAGTTPSPVGDVYDLIADNSVFQEGDVALLGKSEKDADDKRFDRAQSYAERNNPGVKVEAVVTPLFAGGVSGTQMRNLILQGDEKEFKRNLPNHLSKDEKDLAFRIVQGSTNERLGNIIDSTLEEISAMSGGGVQGASTPFGRPNTYNTFKRVKKTRPKRAKRARRR